MECNISKCTSYFHDGNLKDIDHRNNKIIFTMSSAEMHEDELTDDITLSSKDNFKCLRGKLHVEGIRKIQVDDKPFLGRLKKHFDSGEILHLEIKKNYVELSIAWINYPPKPRDEDFSTIQVEADKIYWENTPVNQT